MDVNAVAATRTEGPWTLAPQLNAVHPDSVRSVYGRSPNHRCFLRRGPAAEPALSPRQCGR